MPGQPVASVVVSITSALSTPECWCPPMAMSAHAPATSGERLLTVIRARRTAHPITRRRVPGQPDSVSVKEPWPARYSDTALHDASITGARPSSWSAHPSSPAIAQPSPMGWGTASVPCRGFSSLATRQSTTLAAIRGRMVRIRVRAVSQGARQDYGVDHVAANLRTRPQAALAGWCHETTSARPCRLRGADTGCLPASYNGGSPASVVIHAPAAQANRPSSGQNDSGRSANDHGHAWPG